MPQPPLINCQDISKTYGERPLFEGLSLAIHEGDRIGLTGPNGAGKSTFLKILAEVVAPDDGACTRRKGLRVGYVPQRPTFTSESDPDPTVAQVVATAAGNDGHEAGRALSRTGFTDHSVRASTLSGGWNTRLAIACALVGDPDLLLLDEPTNHLDVDSIVWLESLLASAAKTFVVISHDRYFLQNVARRMVDIDRMYPEGVLSVSGGYVEMLEARDARLSGQANYQESLANRVRREVEWLRRGPKARTSKSKARIDAAHRSISELAESRDRTAGGTTLLELNASGRKTKRLWQCRGLGKRFDDTPVFEDLELLLGPGVRLGVVGPIGSGKSTLLRTIVGELEPDSGSIKKVDDLRLVYFDQARSGLDTNQTLKRALAPEGDTLVYRDHPVHVVSWAKRFLFRPSQLDQSVSLLSGGERARVVLARLMLKPADLLVLDEPTNDLDIPTLEVLEESLIGFPGALVLVSHDRQLVDRVTTAILALDGRGGTQRYADYHQWQEERTAAKAPKKSRAAVAKPTAPKRKRLSYNEQREYGGMEQKILEAETRAEEARARTEDPAIATDPTKLQERFQAMADAQSEVDRLYARWAELEAMLS
ncbi:MAG: ATP-binding cassette domain-containing protein [Acidobacteria bacterium]|nr:ATP-binding cassette domain-containing protein [Acidobacteriota bacterium]